jgi:hypothetical protein
MGKLMGKNKCMKRLALILALLPSLAFAQDVTGMSGVEARWLVMQLRAE